TPGARIDVEQLVLLVAGIELVFELDQAIVIDGAQESLGVVFENRNVDGFDIGAGFPELHGMLAPATGDHFPDCLAIAKECTICQLLEAATWNQLLYDDLARTY